MDLNVAFRLHSLFRLTKHYLCWKWKLSFTKQRLTSCLNALIVSQFGWKLNAKPRNQPPPASEPVPQRAPTCPPGPAAAASLRGRRGAPDACEHARASVCACDEAHLLEIKALHQWFYVMIMLRVSPLVPVLVPVLTVSETITTSASRDFPLVRIDALFPSFIFNPCCTTCCPRAT